MITIGNFLDAIRQTIGTLLAANIADFIGSGRILFVGLAAIVLAIWGSKIALAQQGMDWSGLIQHVLFLAVPHTMLTYYQTPASFLGGNSFTGLIMNGSKYFADKIGADVFDQVTAGLIDYAKQNPMDRSIVTPGFMTGLFLWFTIQVFIALMFIIMGWGFIAQAVLLLVGPIFIPFIVFEPLNWLFWGWFKSFFQYSFYPVIAAAVVKIIGILMLSLLNAKFVGGVAIFPVLLACCAALISTPALVSHIFSGSSSGGGLGGIVKMAAGKML